jgi:hypothetical protein
VLFSTYNELIKGTCLRQKTIWGTNHSEELAMSSMHKAREQCKEGVLPVNVCNQSYI